MKISSSAPHHQKHVRSEYDRAERSDFEPTKLTKLKRKTPEEHKAKKKAKQQEFESTLTPNAESETQTTVPKEAELSVTLVVPSTCISDTVVKSYQQAVHTAYQIARAAVAYNVDEIVIYEPSERPDIKQEKTSKGETSSFGKPKIVFNSDASNDQKPELSERAVTLASLLQFFVTPDYLRKSIFTPETTTTNFEYAKKLPKLLLPFMESRDARYKEGMSIPMILNKNVKSKISKQKRNVKKAEAKGVELQPPTIDGATPYINIGAAEPHELEYGESVPVGVRVTVDTKENKVVSAKEAYGRDTGYSVRVATDFSHIFTMPSTPEGYDYTVWCPGGEFRQSELEPETQPKPILALPRTVKRPLFVFGQWDHVEDAVKHDTALGVSGAKELFDSKVDFKRPVRVEDGVLVALDRLA